MENTDGAPRKARITIVGGRPPEDERSLSDVPAGMQNLLLMAGEDDRLRAALVENREDTLERCSALLSETEKSVLRSVPSAQLAQMIERLQSPRIERRDFLKAAAAAVVALLSGAMASAALADTPQPSPSETPHPTRGIRPDRPTPKPSSKPSGSPSPTPSPDDLPPPTRGIQPDHPPSKGHRPDRP